MEKELNIYAFYGPSNGRRVNGQPMGSGEDYRVKSRYEEYKACGFDTLLLEHEADYRGEEFATSELKRVMDICQEVGLQVVLLDERLEKMANCGIPLLGANLCICGQEYYFDTEECIDRFVIDCMKDYSKHPAFRGIYLMDEPTVGQLETLCRVQRAIKKHKPDTYIHVCLNPMCQSSGTYISDDTLGIEENYRKYIAYYLEHGNNETVFYDDYPLRYDSRDGKYFLQNYIRSMEIVREESIRRGIRCGLTIGSFSDESNPEAGFCRLNEAALRMQALIPLAYGFQGLSWFYYWEEPYSAKNLEREKYRQSIIKENGEHDLYELVQKINGEVKTLSRELFQFHYIGTEFFSAEEEIPDYFSAQQEYHLQKIQNLSCDKNLFVSEFKNGDRWGIFFMNFNNPINQIPVNVGFEVEADELRYCHQGMWKDMKKNEGMFQLHLSPGDGVFVLL